MHDSLKVIAERYSEQQLMKAQDIVGDLCDELKNRGLNVESGICGDVFNFLSDAINIA